MGTFLIEQKSPAAPTEAIPSPQRWVALDALRGVAALWVAWYHFYRFTTLPGLLDRPDGIDWFLLHGYLGVEIFFVLSGVVISLSVMGAKITWPYTLSFAIRRSIRLDPPYWAILALACLLRALTGDPVPLPSALAHVAYLQNILGFPNVVQQFWTLCYEVQFYLVLICFIALAQKAGKVVGWLAVLLPLAISLYLYAYWWPPTGWFIDYWYAFALGVATTGMLRKRINPAVWALATGFVLVAGFERDRIEMMTVAVTVMVIGMTGLAGKLPVWSGGVVFRYLGRVSYSFYLVHFLGTYIARILAARADSAFEGILVFIAATLIALGFAEILHRLVEAPAHALSRRFGRSIASRLTRSAEPVPSL